MELNSKTLNSLKILAREDTLSDEDFTKIIGYIFDSYAVNIERGSLDVNLDLTHLEASWKNKSLADLKEAAAAVYMLITELGRNSSDRTVAR